MNILKYNRLAATTTRYKSASKSLNTTDMTRLLSNAGLAPNLFDGVALLRLSTTGFQLTGNNPTQIGQQIAPLVFGGIGHE